MSGIWVPELLGRGVTDVSAPVHTACPSPSAALKSMHTLLPTTHLPQAAGQQRPRCPAQHPPDHSS